ncbi:MAG: hypothetical protein OCD76_09550 [Reichenbachiella sp.]
MCYHTFYWLTNPDTNEDIHYDDSSLENHTYTKIRIETVDSNKNSVPNIEYEIENTKKKKVLGRVNNLGFFEYTAKKAPLFLNVSLPHFIEETFEEKLDDAFGVEIKISDTAGAPLSSETIIIDQKTQSTNKKGTFLSIDSKSPTRAIIDFPRLTEDTFEESMPEAFGYALSMKDSAKNSVGAIPFILNSETKALNKKGEYVAIVDNATQVPEIEFPQFTEKDFEEKIIDSFACEIILKDSTNNGVAGSEVTIDTVPFILNKKGCYLHVTDTIPNTQSIDFPQYHESDFEEPPFDAFGVLVTLLDHKSKSVPYQKVTIDEHPGILTKKGTYFTMEMNAPNDATINFSDLHEDSREEDLTQLIAESGRRKNA